MQIIVNTDLALSEEDKAKIAANLKYVEGIKSVNILTNSVIIDIPITSVEQTAKIGEVASELALIEWYNKKQ